MPRDAKVEGELLEIVLAEPASIHVLRAEVAIEDFKHELYRRLLGICYRLSEEGAQPSYENMMSAVEDPALKQLVVALEEAARVKAQKVRVDCAVETNIEEETGRQALLKKLIRVLKQRADEEQASLGRLALQSGPSGRSPAATLDAVQLEALRRATEISGGGRGSGERRRARQCRQTRPARVDAKTTN